jgi:hypothetical protein
MLKIMLMITTTMTEMKTKCTNRATIKVIHLHWSRNCNAMLGCPSLTACRQLYNDWFSGAQLLDLLDKEAVGRWPGGSEVKRGGQNACTHARTTPHHTTHTHITHTHTCTHITPHHTIHFLSLSQSVDICCGRKKRRFNTTYNAGTSKKNLTVTTTKTTKCWHLQLSKEEKEVQ